MHLIKQYILVKYVIFLGLFIGIFACKPDPETARQTHSVFTQERDKYKITRITESALRDSVDAIAKIFVHELNNSLVPLLLDSVFVCDKTNLSQPAPTYIIDYQLVCDENIQLKLEPDVLNFLLNSYEHQIQKDTVLGIEKTSFLYVSPVYSDSTYTGVWGILINRRQFIKNL